MPEVIIAGAGPVGLFLASELAVTGVSVLILEREDEPSRLWSLPTGLRGLNAGSAEAFYRRGMLELLLEASHVEAARVGAPPDATEAPPPRDLSHFAGMGLDSANIDLATLPRRLPSPAMEGFMTSMEAVVNVLSQRAMQTGVEIIRGAAVSGLSQDDDGVTVTAGDTDYRAEWLVGCDGGRSAVRRLGGFEFVGTEPLFTGYVAQVSLDHDDGLRPGFQLTPTGMYLKTPWKGHLGMMDFDGGAFDRSSELTADHIQAVLRRISGTDASVSEVNAATTFTDRSMQATEYRNGRVLLAGDAAHIHSPLGGQGLNLGIGDAMNLGWKLASTVRGVAFDDLLDSYSRERIPIGAAVLDWSRAQVATMQPGPNAPALQGLMHQLMSTPDGATLVYQRTSGLGNRYDLGDSRPLVGRSAPDFHFRDGLRLGELLREGKSVVLEFDADGSLSPTVDRWAGAVSYHAGPAYDDLGLDAAMVRPDGVVAWVAERGDLDQRSLKSAITRWHARAAVARGSAAGDEAAI